MSNSVTAAKRRRAGPLLTSPLFQAPNSNKPATNAPVPAYNPNVQQMQNNTRPVQQQVEAPSPRGLTLQQVISQLDTRLLFLEQFVIDSKAATNLKPATIKDITNNEPVSQINENSVSVIEVENIVKQLLDEHMSEFSHRYDLLAAEILSLKFIVMKLQTYTLDVNKALMDERIRILSDLGDNNGLQNNTDGQVEPDLSVENSELDNFAERSEENAENQDQNEEIQEQLVEASENNITTEIVENMAEPSINDNYEKTVNALA